MPSRREPRGSPEEGPRAAPVLQDHAIAPGAGRIASGRIPRGAGSSGPCRRVGRGEDRQRTHPARRRFSRAMPLRRARGGSPTDASRAVPVLRHHAVAPGAGRAAKGSAPRGFSSSAPCRRVGRSEGRQRTHPARRRFSRTMPSRRAQRGSAEEAPGAAPVLQDHADRRVGRREDRQRKRRARRRFSRTMPTVASGAARIARGSAPHGFGSPGPCRRVGRREDRQRKRLARLQFFSTMQSPPERRMRSQRASASSRLCPPSWACHIRPRRPGRLSWT
jgi:hypothetical protein